MNKSHILRLMQLYGNWFLFLNWGPYLTTNKLVYDVPTGVNELAYPPLKSKNSIKLLQTGYCSRKNTSSISQYYTVSLTTFQRLSNWI